MFGLVGAIIWAIIVFASAVCMMEDADNAWHGGKMASFIIWVLFDILAWILLGASIIGIGCLLGIVW